jgi:uncharacterized membrane protein
MKPLSWAGIVLIVLGAIALAYQGFNYQSKQNVVDFGSMHVTATTEKRFEIPPVVGGIIILGGIILVIAGSRKKA